MNMELTKDREIIETIIKERNTEIRGSVKCGVCGELTKVEPPYMYTLRTRREILVGDMLNFVCSDCFEKQKNSPSKQ